MNAKKYGIGFGIIFICAVFAIAIVIGVNRQEKVQAAIQKQNELLDIGKAEAEKRAAAELAALKPNGSPRSYIDDIRYHNALYDNQPFRLTAIGSSVTAGTGASNPNKNWVSLLVTELKKVDGYTSISYSNEGYGGYTTGKLISEGKVDELIKKNPEMVLFETCLLNDHGQNVQLSETLKNIETIVDSIKKSLPETKIVLLAPNQSVDRGKNTQGLALADYVNGVKQLAEEKDWDFIDVYGGFVSQNLEIKNYLSDEVHPNDKGYEVWFEIVKKEFEKKK